MTLSVYDLSIPMFLKTLDNLTAILKKAETNAASRKIDLAVFVNARLAPDMFPLKRQIQIATDGVKGFAARMAGIPVPSYEDNEETFADLYARIEKTAAFLKTVTPEQLNGSETKDISLKAGSRELNFKGLPYLTGFVIPNFYFHVSVVYAILRHNGVDIGKQDYLGQYQ